MGKSKIIEETMKSYGWNDQKESTFFKDVHSLIGDEYKGTFTIKKVKGTWYWYYKFSSHRITPRTKYICSCEVETKSDNTSFDNCKQVFLDKLKHNFSNNRSINQNLSKYIDEFIQKCMVDGGLSLEKRKRGEKDYEVLTFTGYTNKDGRKNTSTMKRYIRSLTEFKDFCIENKVKTKSVLKDEFRDTFHEYFKSLVNRNKRDRKGNVSPNSSKHLEPSSIKLNLQSVRGFLNWLCTPKNEYGKGLFKKKHDITSNYQNHLISRINKTQKDDKIVDFDSDDYEKCVKELSIVILKYWIQYCERKGNREYFRKELLSYNSSMTSKPHTNQPKGVIIMSDIVFFVSYLQLKYGFRITEILHSYRNKESHDEHTNTTKVSSFFRKEKSRDGFHYYNLVIKNSKGRDLRSVPIDETIKTTSKPPNGVPHKIETRGIIEFYHTNIIDVIFELFHPKEHHKTFPSPNTSKKSDRGYSTTYYINLFKEKLVLDQKYQWKNRGIESTHDLRLFFVSYMLRQGVNPVSIGSITGQSLNTIMKYYNRLSSKEQLETLEHTKLRKILKNRKGL